MNSQGSAVFRRAIGPWPPFGQTNFFWHSKKFEKVALAPVGVSISGQEKFGPLFEMLNMPLSQGDSLHIGYILPHV